MVSIVTANALVFVLTCVCWCRLWLYIHDHFSCVESGLWLYIPDHLPVSIATAVTTLLLAFLRINCSLVWGWYCDCVQGGVTVCIMYRRERFRFPWDYRTSDCQQTFTVEDLYIFYLCIQKSLFATSAFFFFSQLFVDFFFLLPSSSFSVICVYSNLVESTNPWKIRGGLSTYLFLIREQWWVPATSTINHHEFKQELFFQRQC